MDGVPKSGFFARRRVPRRVADIARGNGPQQSSDTVTGIWNMYTWQAIAPGLALPDAGNRESTAFWIWNEGTPEDIPAFQGRRAVLLGPASYPRSWRSQRMFRSLQARLEIEHVLTKNEIGEWLQQMLDAKLAG
jgi:hypothetical protein